MSPTRVSNGHKSGKPRERPTPVDIGASSQSVAVVGLGYVGLGLAHLLSEAGFSVYGYDIDQERVNSLAQGMPPISELSQENLASMLANGFTLSTSPRGLETCNVVIFALPTPVDTDRLPNISALISGLQAAAQHRKSQQLWIIESTIAPGVVEEKVLPTLQAAGLVHGEDYLLALSPERIDPGGGPSLASIPKIVSGLNLEARTQAEAFYRLAGFPIVLADSIDAAASAKLLENAYRAVNIALINELAPLLSAKGISTHEMVRLAATKPFGFEAFWPGTGVGGHCIPVDPWYLTSALGLQASDKTLISTALEISRGTLEAVARRVCDLLPHLFPGEINPSVVLYGMSYKANVGDFRESAGPELARLLHGQGVALGYHDPFLSAPLPELNGLRWETDLGTATSSYDLALILQSHQEYHGLANLWGGRLVLSAAPSQHQFAPHIWSVEVGEPSRKEDIVGLSDSKITSRNH